MSLDSLMTPLFWFPLWLLAGVPFATMASLRKLFSRRKTDYAYYLEWKWFPKWKVTFAKLVPSIILGGIFVLSSALGENMLLGLCIYIVCSTLAESTVLIGRPHPTPEYQTRQLVCEKCRSRRDDECTNVRMLDGFERCFRSANGRYRPVYCCGFRMSEWQTRTV